MCDPYSDALGREAFRVMPHYDRIMEQNPSQSTQNSNTISQPAAAEGNPGHLMYSHILHLTQWLSTGSYQHPTDTRANLDARIFTQRFTCSL